MVSQTDSPPKETKSKSSSKKKFKKNALEFVDYEQEFQKDPKFKTELCKTFTDTGFCAYGNKCRFAHGKDELFNKLSTHPKYRKSDCITFHSNGFCNYGQRCHFKHHEFRKLDSIGRSYYTLKLSIYEDQPRKHLKRLPVLENVTLLNGYYARNPIMKRMISLTPKLNNNVNGFTPVGNFQAKQKQIFISERKSSTSSSVHSKSPINSTVSVEEAAVMSRFAINRKLNFNDIKAYVNNEYSEYEIHLYQ